MRSLRQVAAVIAVAVVLLKADGPVSPTTSKQTVRATGLVRAVTSVTILVSRIEGLGGSLTLTTMVENGALVDKGASLATFDRANELKLLRDTQSRFDDADHLIQQK